MQCDFRVDQQVIDVGAGVGGGVAEAAGEVKPPPVQGNRAGDGSGKLARQPVGGTSGLGQLGEDREPPQAAAGDQGVACRPGKLLSDVPEHPIASPAADRLVDHVELLQVDEEQRRGLSGFQPLAGVDQQHGNDYQPGHLVGGAGAGQCPEPGDHEQARGGAGHGEHHLPGVGIRLGPDQQCRRDEQHDHREQPYRRAAVERVQGQEILRRREQRREAPARQHPDAQRLQRRGHRRVLKHGRQQAADQEPDRCGEQQP